MAGGEAEAEIPGGGEGCGVTGVMMRNDFEKCPVLRVGLLMLTVDLGG